MFVDVKRFSRFSLVFFFRNNRNSSMFLAAPLCQIWFVRSLCEPKYLLNSVVNFYVFFAIISRKIELCGRWWRRWWRADRAKKVRKKRRVDGKELQRTQMNWMTLKTFLRSNVHVVVCCAAARRWWTLKIIADQRADSIVCGWSESQTNIGFQPPHSRMKCSWVSLLCVLLTCQFLILFVLVVGEEPGLVVAGRETRYV